MKPNRRHLIAATLVAAIGFGAAVQAQTPPAGAPGAGRPDAARMEQFRARMQERMAQRLGELKQKLAITPAQEGAWSTWTANLQPTPHQRPDRAEIARLTTPERIDRMRALRAERNAAMDKRMDATKTFYAQLNAEQKKTFDAESLRFLGGKGGRGHGHHGGPRG
ncbi:Spy/CpxP family protein refolding chaperone [Ramlibacter sp. USB13]|uniref:Spy/CpxP family protein refolding chaperone n=1 Tax=Ramlibacter cellulosilyticus TaxID=2764187 RepID=A0A923MNH4_9BURK|nr:Spy/CpxP family protein refolding chaperone [Ramlibacter cellulosilyticus]MBC5782585.1 Spy/CpxP family protein refolding chaperone [Ramlibacter cellulosilyticus]